MARDFPGANSNYLRVSDPVIDNITGTAFTLSVFCRPNSATTGDQLCAKLDSGVLVFDVFLESGTLTGRIRGGGITDSVNSTVGLSTINWNHVVLRKNGTGANALQIYINGVLTGQATSDQSIGANTEDFYIGNRGNNDIPWNGWIAEVAFWQATLTTNEITQLSLGALANTIQPTLLRGYWPLCGLTLPELDFSGNNAHSTLTGSAPFAVHPFNNSICVPARYAPPSHVGGRGAA